MLSCTTGNHALWNRNALSIFQRVPQCQLTGDVQADARYEIKLSRSGTR